MRSNDDKSGLRRHEFGSDDGGPHHHHHHHSNDSTAADYHHAGDAGCPTDRSADRLADRDTHETIDPNEGFIGSSPVTVSDGGGGYFTAVSALRNPSADGHGALIFFWHNQTFLGWDTNEETWNVMVRSNGADAIEATYADYAPGNPACCPTLPPVTITYSWSGNRFAQSRTIPPGAVVGIAVSSA